MKTILYILVLFVFHFLVFGEESTNSERSESVVAINQYLTNLTKESALDFTIILTANRYYEDGTIQEVETLAFASKAEDDTILKDFDLSALSRTDIKKLVADAKANDVLLSLHQEKTKDGEKTTDDFDTTQPEALNSAAANVVLHPEGFVAGLEKEIANTMDLTDSAATIQVLEYFEEGGKVKRNTTTTVYTNKVTVVDSYKMTPRMIQGSAELLRKAYKIDMDDRTPLIGQLFDKQYPRYDWKVLTNSTAHITKKAVSVTLAIGQDKYDILGVSKQ